MKRSNHTFVICAYKEQPFLDSCVKSLKAQTLKSEIIISTSTPNKMVEEIAKKNNVKLVINTETSGHINDFCFAYKQASTKYVTLCHQDDIYYETFAEDIVKKMNKSKNSIIGFSNYNECRNGKTVKRNTLLLIKRIINFPLTVFGRFKAIRLLTLSLGNAICAPSVTYNKEKVEEPIIKSDLKANIDWDTWIYLAKKKGSFIYVKKPLLEHRIHEGSTTTAVINNNVMTSENYLMFRKFWPAPIAKLFSKVYSTSENSNSLSKKKKEKFSMMKFLMVAVYLILTVSGLILYKYGANKGFAINLTNNMFNLKISLISILGLVCYLLSFIIYMLILPSFDISYLMPLTSAISYISIFIMSAMVLGEKITTNGIIGTFVILVGIIILNIRR